MKYWFYNAAIRDKATQQTLMHISGVASAPNGMTAPEAIERIGASAADNANAANLTADTYVNIEHFALVDQDDLPMEPTEPKPEPQSVKFDVVKQDDDGTILTVKGFAIGDEVEIAHGNAAQLAVSRRTVITGLHDTEYAKVSIDGTGGYIVAVDDLERS